MIDYFKPKKHQPTIAEVFVSVGEDYHPVSKIIDFSPGEMAKTFPVTIVDDANRPLLEGPETFELFFSFPVGGRLGKPSITMVTINDSVSDCE